jgi:ribonucleoside-triphosphate reductase
MNLPRMGYKARHDEDLIFEELDAKMSLIQEILMIRRNHTLKCLNEYKIFPFLSQDYEGEQYYQIDNATLSFGFNGLNEMLLSLFGEGIENPDSNKFGIKVIKYINDHAHDLQDETGLRWSTIQTPAESTAYRFASLDHEMYPEQVISNGVPGAYYYTNSSHVPVDTNKSIISKIRTEEPYHKYTLGGHIFHAFMGESYSDPDSLMSLTEKIAKNSDIGFWAYSSALSFCLKCKTLMKGLNNKCPNCGETDEVEWYDRITGYVQQVGHAKSANGGWNNGKKQELKDRTRFQQ